MKSKASVKHHPIHPMLVSFPIAFLSGVLVFDALGFLTGRPELWTTAAYLGIAGVASGLVAAVPGLVDYTAVVPPNSSAKQRATRHMFINVSALLLFGLAWFLRGGLDASASAPSAAVLVLELAGFALMAGAGWLGGTLAFANQIGVNHRYANAGRGQEATVNAAPGKAVAVAKSNELQVDQLKLLHIGDQRLVLGRNDDGYVVFDDRCTHKGGSLADGVLICGIVQCPWHGSQFNVRTGAVSAGPADSAIRTYRVEEIDGEVRLTL